MQHRRLVLLAIVVSVFALAVVIWYMFFAAPTEAPSLGGTNNPLPTRSLPARFGFIFQGNGPEQTTETEVTAPGSLPFVQVWNKPATGNVFVTKTVLRQITASSTSTSSPQVIKTVRASSTMLMFVDRATGYVYGYSIESGKVFQISNTTLPGIYDAYIFAGGTKVLMRYLDSDRKTIRSVLAGIQNVQEGEEPQPLVSVTNLQNNIRSVAISDSLSSVSYLVPHDGGSSIYTINQKGITKTVDSPFSEWKLVYGGENLYATTLPSAYVEGVTVSLPSFSVVIGEKTGLMSVPAPSGNILSSMWSDRGLLTFSASKGSISVLSIKTLADKCKAVLSAQFICGVPASLPPSAEGLPDDWYQGKTLFQDELMVISPATGDAYTLFTFPDKDGPMDVTHLSTTAKADLVSFIRKNDGTLWLLNTNLLN